MRYTKRFLAKQKKFSISLFTMLLVTLTIPSHASVQNVWQDTNSETPLNLTTEKLQPTYYRIISLNDASLNALRHDLSRKNTAELLLPLPEGDFSLFTVSNAHTMPPELAKRWPNILSLKGFDKEGRRVRLDISQQGLQAMVFDTTGNWLIQSAGNKFNNNQTYQSFRLEALRTRNTPSREKLTVNLNATQQVTPSKPRLTNDNIHREYRIAIAMDSDYVKKYGGTVEGGLANAVRTINRINEIYASDFGIHLILVKDNDKIIFANPATDPYLNLSADDARKKNIIVLNSVIGTKNYDLGHLFSRAVGGGTSNGIVCQVNKADGSSGSATQADDGTPNPPEKDISEPTFDLIAAHEIGHEFNANHSFNGCDRDPDSASSAYEPGSGSTIMSYAGECFDEYTPPLHQDSLENLQDHKDPYFHASTIAEVKTFVTGPASVCGKKISNPNRPPVIDPRSTTPFGKRIITIPANTPFVLHGYARTYYHRNAKLTYTWEQMDLGPAQPIKTPLRDDGLGPIFRSYLPNSSGERIFPRLNAVLGKEALGLGEVYPSTTRKLHFRLTVRDNLQEQATTAHADMLINVLNTGFIFSVGPVDTAWKSGEKKWVNWNVAGTNHEPIACKTVRIDLSTDGGYTFLPKSLARKVPNQGSFAIVVPNLVKPTDYARLRISCNENLFFALSPHNFSITK